jgi:hypothetical protein
MAVAAPMHARADDCPGRDLDACVDLMPVDDPDEVTAAAPEVTVPVVDADGDVIPYVEEAIDPVPLSP